MLIIMNIIFAVIMYPLLLVMYFLLRGAGDDNRAYCFGATLSSSQRQEGAVKQIVAEYKKSMKRDTIILAVIPVVCFFIPFMSIAMTIWFIWILAVCFWPMIHFAIANKKIQELKVQMGWKEEYEVSYIDLNSVTVTKKVKLKEFLLPILLSILPIIISLVFFGKEDLWILAFLVAVFAVCTILFYLCAVWTDRQKVSVISSDSDANVNYARAKKQIWKNLWLASCWVNTLFTWFMLLVAWKRQGAMWGIVIGSALYGIVIIAVCVIQMKKLRQVDEIYADKKTIMNAADDDRNWIFGMIYYNKKDTHYMVENRMGTGTTVNLATKAGVVTNVIGALAILIIPVLCIWMILVEMTPIFVTVEKDVIICQQLSTDYEIPLSEITNYKVVEELPEMTKMNGIGMENIYVGTFEIYREGTFEVFLNSQNEKFLWIETKDETYYVSGATDEMTEEILEVVEEYMK